MDVVQVLLAAQSSGASISQRLAAQQLLDSLKASEPRTAANTAVTLLAQGQAPESRLLGFNLMQHLVRHRWDEFASTDQTDLANMALGVMVGIDASELWAIKSKAATLVAEVMRRGGPSMFAALLPSVLQSAAKGPAAAEAAARCIAALAEDVVVHNEDLEPDRMRALLLALTASLSQLLPFVYRLLEVHFAAAMAAASQGAVAEATAHAAAVNAALVAAQSCAEWAPVAALAHHRLIDACGHLLAVADFQLPACDVLRAVAARKRTSAEDGPVWDAALGRTAEALAAAAAQLRAAGVAFDSDGDTPSAAFARRLCAAMAELMASGHLPRAGPLLESCLHHTLAFAAADSLQLAATSLTAWLASLRREGPPPGTGTPAEGLPHGCREALAVIVADQLQKYAGAVKTQRDPPPGGGWESVAEYRDAVARYRSQLLECAKLLGAQVPAAAAELGLSRLEAALARAGATGDTADGGAGDAGLDGAAAYLEAATAALATPTTDGKSPSAGVTAARASLRALVLRLLGTPWGPPRVAIQHVRALEVAGRLGASGDDGGQPALLPAVLDKLFGLLETTPGPPGANAPAAPPGARPALETLRHRACAAVLHVGAQAPGAMQTHLVATAERVEALWRAGRLYWGEHNVLCDALLSISSGADPVTQQRILAWLLAPIQAAWAAPEFQAALTGPAMFMRRYAGAASPEAMSGVVGGGPLRLALFHELHLLDRCVRRLHPPKPVAGGAGGPASPGAAPRPQTPAGLIPMAPVPGPTPIAAHLPWLLPPVLALIRCLHALWGPDGGAACLPPPLAASLRMGNLERVALLQQGPVRASRAAAAAAVTGDSSRGADAATAADDARDEVLEGIDGSSPASLRVWLNGIREHLYQIVGLSAVRAQALFEMDGLAAAAKAPLLEHFGNMAPTHMRTLLRIVILPWTQQAAAAAYRRWPGASCARDVLLAILPPVLEHMHAMLPAAWCQLAAPADGNSDGSRLDDEVLRERLLVDLTREHCGLLAMLATPDAGAGAAAPAIAGAPSPPGGSGVGKGVKGKGSKGQMPAPRKISGPGDNGASQSREETVLEMLLSGAPAAALAAVRTALVAITWPDRDAARKSMSLCRTAAQAASDPAAPALLRELVATEAMAAALAALSLPSSVDLQAELLGLMRDVLVGLGPTCNPPRQQLLQVGLTVAAVGALDAALATTNSEREQRAAIRKTLLAAGGDKLAAFSSQPKVLRTAHSVDCVVLCF